MMNTKYNPMTSDQKQALRMMSEQNIGAMVTRFGWTWPETVRNNEEAAGEVIRILSCPTLVARTSLTKG
jgi:hypothetical protein